MTKVNYLKLKEFCRNALKKNGMNDRDASIMADVLVTTDMWGIYTHGTKNLFGYICKKKCGGVSFSNEPKIEVEYPAAVVIDGNNTMGFISSVMAMKKACEYARINGIGISFVKNSCHYGASGYYANIAANEGMIGMVFSNVDKKMTIPGAKGVVMGHNPFALAAPSSIIPSVILDISSSNVASLKVLKAKEEKKTVPNNWIIDKDGIPTTDPSKYPEEGALLPFGEHKGYGIALFVEILTSIILGKENSTSDAVKSWCFDMDKPNNVCHSFIAINTKIIDGIEFIKNLDKLIEDLHKVPSAKHDGEVTVPGEKMWEKYRAAEKDGLEIPDNVLEEILKVSKESEIDMDIYNGPVNLHK